MSTIWAFDNIGNKHTLYRGEDCMKKFCTSLREHAINVINIEKKHMLPLTKKELKVHQDVTECYICGKRFLKHFANDKNYRKVRGHCHFTGKYKGAAHSICNLRFNVPNEIPVVFHNRSNYDYHFIIKELANEGKFECLGENAEKYKTFSIPTEKELTEINKGGYESVEFEGKFECLGENAEKYKTFSIPTEKELTEINKGGYESVVTISYEIKFIDTSRFMATSLSNLVDNLTERIRKTKCKGFDCFLEYESVKVNLIKYKCLTCNKDY